MDDLRVTRWPRAVVAAALVVAALAACASTPRSAGPGAGLGGGFHLAQIGGGPAGEDHTLHVVRVPSPPANAHEWTVAAVDPSSHRIRIHYTDGACTSADRLALQETATTVVIGITASTAFSGNCIAVGIPRSAVVVLREPLGARALMEGATGANDGLSEVDDPSTLPAPTCGPDDPSDVPAGMRDVASRIAPSSATRAFVCRTWWPNGRARTESTTVTDSAQVSALADALNDGVRDARPGPIPAERCPKRVEASWYAVYLEGPGVQVEVKADEISCATITNGALSGTMTSAAMSRLDALFH